MAERRHRFYGPGNKIMVLGTGRRTESGDVELTNWGKRRLDAAAAEFFKKSFNRKSDQPIILVSGGYGKKLFPDRPPTNREAPQMRDYLVETYDICPSKIAVEDESVDTEENIIKSLEGFPELFSDVNERRLGLASHQEHLEWAVEIGARAIDMSDEVRDRNSWFRLIVAEVPLIKSPIDQLTEEAISKAV